MKLRFDQNLSPRLVAALHEWFPGSAHVRDLHLEAARDEEVWRLAAADGFVIVSKDDDFRQRSFLYGFPPKVVWLRVGNCSTARIIDLLRDHADAIRGFADDQTTSFLVLS